MTYGVSSDYSFYLVAITNASSAVGRLVTGLAVDKTGRLWVSKGSRMLIAFEIGAINFIAPTTFFAGIITFAWPFARSGSSFTAIAVLYG